MRVRAKNTSGTLTVQKERIIKHQEKNVVTVDLTSGATSKTPCDLSQEQINKSANILANVLIDFVKNGGSLKDLTPQHVFGRKGNE